MFTLITILVIIVCLLLLLIVLIQNPKGGLDSAFSANNQVMGVRKTADFLEKATWTMGIALVVLSIASAAVNDTKTINTDEPQQSKIQGLTEGATIPGTPLPGVAPLPEGEEAPTPSEPTEE
ncbi:MAG: preprotein translocase subunit SecG [Vicingus serpentipes]|nr:preprotein translocase subunit SecG [Vicingus serpentipes]